MCKHTGMHLCIRGAEHGQLLPLEPQLFRLSAKKIFFKRPEEMRRKEQEEWEKEKKEERLNEDIPVPTERLWKRGERVKMTGRRAKSRTRRQLWRKAVWSHWI